MGSTGSIASTDTSSKHSSSKYKHGHSEDRRYQRVDLPEVGWGRVVDDNQGQAKPTAGIKMMCS